MNRVTEANLEAIVLRINRITKSPERTWVGGKSMLGNYHLDSANGGLALYRIDNESGGAEDVLKCGHTTKSRLADLMHAFIRGIESAKV